MEFAKLIAPTGEWGKVWLAAHWDKRLKKQDFLEADVRRLIASFQARRISLRTIGHLLLGVCKIYQRKCIALEEDALEVKIGLSLVFDQLADAHPRGGKRAEGSAAAKERVLPEFDEARGDLLSEEAVFGGGGRHHTARLQDITLKDPVVHAPDPRLEAEGGSLFGALPQAELEAALRKIGRKLGLQEERPFGLVECQDAQPLVALERLSFHRPAPGVPLDVLDSQPGLDDAMPLELDIPQETQVVPAEPEPVDEAPLELDLPPAPPVPLADVPPAPEAQLAPGEEPERVEGGSPGGRAAAEPLDGLSVKRRRRVHLILDGATEIPKEKYQAFVNNRADITRKTMFDYTVLLPHHPAGLPNFTTTFTELCPQLYEGFVMGAEVAEKRRRLAMEQEASARGEAFRDGEDVAAPLSVRFPALSPMLQTIPEGQGGLRTPGTPAGPQAEGPPETSAVAPVLPPLRPAMEDVFDPALLRHAPQSMGAVVTGNMDQEDQSENAAVRIGYSGRTEKMHRFLAKEIKARVDDWQKHPAGPRPDTLSYEALCREQSLGRRQVIAGCFFELLVLRTNGVIDLKQDEPQADIRISMVDSGKAK